jgi:hypothetical protein
MVRSAPMPSGQPELPGRSQAFDLSFFALALISAMCMLKTVRPRKRLRVANIEYIFLEIFYEIL